MKITGIRQLVLMAVCALAAIGCHAEEYLPFLEIGKWWIVSEVEVGGEFFSYWRLSVEEFGDNRRSTIFRCINHKSDQSRI